MMRISLKHKFLMPTLLLIFLGMGTSAFISYDRSGHALRKSVANQLFQLNGVTARFIRLWMKDRHMELTQWARQRIFQDALKQTPAGQEARRQLQPLLADLADNNPWFESIVLSDTRGDIVSSSLAHIIGKINLGDRRYFQEALGGSLAISDIIRSRTTGTPVFTIAVPVREKTGITGVLFSVVSHSYFNRFFVDSVRIGKSGYAFMYDKKGQLIAFPDPSKVLDTNIRHFEFGPAVTGKESGLESYQEKGRLRLVAFRRVKQIGWTFAITADHDEILVPARQAGYLSGSVALAAMLFVAVLLLMLVSSVVNPVRKVTDGLNKGAEQMASVSNHMASSGHILAQGASEQADSIEKTLSSLEEMAAITHANSRNAAHVRAVMKEAAGTVDGADQAIKALNGIISQVARKSAASSEIIKSIEAIAFQTNLLALNAATEAARAGKSGAGFSVVADEVRNLARRSSEAAQSSSALIRETEGEVSEGVKMAEITGAAFSEVMAGVRKISGLVREIAIASDEQARGIGQVSSAVANIDKVTRQNAANAQEYAAASEEMNNQVRRIRRFAGELMGLIRGRSAPHVYGSPGVLLRKRISGRLPSRDMAAPSADRRTVVSSVKARRHFRPVSLKSKVAVNARKRLKWI